VRIKFVEAPRIPRQKLTLGLASSVLVSWAQQFRELNNAFRPRPSRKPVFRAQGVVSLKQSYLAESNSLIQYPAFAEVLNIYEVA